MGDSQKVYFLYFTMFSDSQFEFFNDSLVARLKNFMQFAFFRAKRHARLHSLQNVF